MNAKRTRWSCRLVRAWVSVGSGRRDHGLAGRHVAHCPECQHFFARAASIEGALRTTAPAQYRAPAAGLEDRILRGIAESARQPEPRRRHTQVIPMLVGAAAAVVLTFVVLHRRYDLTPITTERAASANPTPRQPVAEAKPGIGASFLAMTKPVSSALQKDPLQAEVDSVYADARSAMRFLELNFLPAQAVAQNGDHESRLDGRGPTGG